MYNDWQYHLTLKVKFEKKNKFELCNKIIVSQEYPIKKFKRKYKKED